MHPFKKNHYSLVLFFLILFLPFAWGVTVPADFILKVWLKKKAPLQTIRIHSQTTWMQNNQPTAISFQENLTFNLTTQEFQSTLLRLPAEKISSLRNNIQEASPFSQLLFNSNLQEVISALKKVSLFIPIPTIPSPTSTNSSAVSPPFTPPFALISTGAGLNTPKTTLASPPPQSLIKEFLGRWIPFAEQTPLIAWVICSTSIKESEQTQLWFEKDQFLLRKLIFVHPNGTPYEIHVENYRFLKGIPIAETIHVFQKKKMILRTQLLDVWINDEYSKPTSTENLNPFGTFTTTTLAPEIQNLIEVFYGVLR